MIGLQSEERVHSLSGMMGFPWGSLCVSPHLSLQLSRLISHPTLRLPELLADCPTVYNTALGHRLPHVCSTLIRAGLLLEASL